MILKLKDEFLDSLFVGINENNTLDFDGCFCGGGEFFIGNINNDKVYLLIETSCRKSSGCDNSFYTTRIGFAKEVKDNKLAKEYLEWQYSDEDIEYNPKFDNLFGHNFEDIVLTNIDYIKLNNNSENKIREFLYDKYCEWYDIKPLDYDKNFNK